MNFEEFASFASTYNVIPVSTSLFADTLTPVSAYLRLRKDCKNSFLFESVEGGEHIARYSFIGRDPRIIFKCSDTTTTILEQGETRISKENFFDILDTTIGSFRQPWIHGLPRFNGGLVGFIGYDAVRFIEDIAAHSPPQSLPHSIMGLFTSILVFDHLKHHIIIISNVIVNKDRDLRSQFDGAQETIDHLKHILLDAPPSPGRFSCVKHQDLGETTSSDFHAMVARAKQYILDGDIFQVVLSQRFSTTFEGDVFNVYRALRVINPSPYLYYIDFDGHKVIGSSPEILVRVEDGTAEVYPIAGTRPRGATQEEDVKLEQDLYADEKERAEHIMLVDLGRNDLGRVCEIGTVQVDRLMFTVRYSHVMHIASRVIGKVMPAKSCIDVLKATFPAGTVSGAPKIRAMEIIDELEKKRRGIYAGGVGYFDFSGNMDICIAIRTMFVLDGKIYLQAGAGIVADSLPENEYKETLNKSRALIEALHMAEGIIY